MCYVFRLNYKRKMASGKAITGQELNTYVEVEDIMMESPNATIPPEKLQVYLKVKKYNKEQEKKTKVCENTPKNDENRKRKAESNEEEKGECSKKPKESPHRKSRSRDRTPHRASRRIRERSSSSHSREHRHDQDHTGGYRYDLDRSKRHLDVPHYWMSTPRRRIDIEDYRKDGEFRKHYDRHGRRDHSRQDRDRHDRDRYDRDRFDRDRQKRDRRDRDKSWDRRLGSKRDDSSSSRRSDRDRSRQSISDDRDRGRPSVIMKSENITNEEHMIHYENSAVNYRKAHDTAGERRNYDIETKARINKSPTPTPAESSSSNSSSDESEIEIIEDGTNKNYDIYAKIKSRLLTFQTENKRNITGHRASVPEIKGQEMILPVCTENIPERENIRSLTKLLIGISIRYDTHEAPIIQRAQFEANSGMLDTTTMDEPECENLKVYLENLKGHEVIGHGTKTGLFHYADMSFTKEMKA